MKVTTKEIAEICGVSIGTVDRALHHRSGIKTTTKEKILKVADDLGYRPHLLARSLKKGKTMTIGVAIFELDNPFFSQLVTAIEAHAYASGYFVYLTITDGDPQEEKEYLEHLAGLNVDGILLFPVNGGRDFAQYLKRLNTPIVTIGNRVSKTLPFVGIKDRQAIKEAVLHIAAKGYEQIIYVSPPLEYRGKENIYSVEERLAGYKEGIAALNTRYTPVILRNKKYREQLESMSFEASRTAILCSSDIYALEILNLFRGRGIRVPEDVGLMGFDNIKALKYVVPSLTTIGYPIQEMGYKVVDCLLAQINSTPCSAIGLLDHVIIEGESL
jgi:LacI family transcriptional regulator